MNISLKVSTGFFKKYFSRNRKDNKASVIQEAEQRIDKLFQNNFKLIAKELKGLEIYQFIRAISAGLQEFIEARTFCEYLKNEDSNFSDWNKVNERLVFKSEDESEGEFSIQIDPCEFILGLADLTGEVMRNCINSLGSGDTDNCFKSCKFLQEIFMKFLSLRTLTSRGRDFAQKMSTMRSSTLKCESVCYNLVVRGKEGLKMMSFDANPADEEADEGFF